LNFLADLSPEYKNIGKIISGIIGKSASATKDFHRKDFHG
jgi:hypothetical protein